MGAQSVISAMNLIQKQIVVVNARKGTEKMEIIPAHSAMNYIHMMKIIMVGIIIESVHHAKQVVNATILIFIIPNVMTVFIMTEAIVKNAILVTSVYMDGVIHALKDMD
jgi:hypothetical protein